MITNCPHQEKAFVGGAFLSVCKDCRQKNLREFYKHGTDYVAYEPPPPRYVYHTSGTNHCEHCAGLD